MVRLKIIKNIFKIHFLFYVIGFICIITGLFKNFIIFTSIILVHELGHFLIALIFKWKIDKVVILPFGGITIFNENIDKPLYQELLIAIAGPIFQMLFFIIFKDNQLFSNYNITILLFNLLPIFPLDGSKIFNIIFNKFISFKYSHILSIIVSYVFIIISILNIKLNYLFILLFIICEVFKETRNHKYIFNRFLLERYLFNYDFKKKKIITKIEQMKKQTKHIFKKHDKYYLEREIIRKRFDN